MGTISYSNISDGTTIDADDVNDPFNTIYDEFNGNIDSNNIASGGVGTSAIANDAVTDAKRPRLLATKVYRSATQTISDATDETMSWGQEEFDDPDWHDSGTNPERITVDEAGLYFLNVAISFASNATGRRIIKFQKNGSDFMNAGSAAASGGDTLVTLSDVQILAASDYITVDVFQNSGGNLAVQAESYMSVVKLSD